MESPFKVDIVKGKVALEFGRHGASVDNMGRRKSVLDSPNEDATRVVNATFQHFGRIDILVNAAAGNFLVPAEDYPLMASKQ
ncbi:hypothetical protein MKX03_026886, partial [Papaver bracteatum]